MVLKLWEQPRKLNRSSIATGTTESCFATATFLFCPIARCQPFSLSLHLTHCSSPPRVAGHTYLFTSEESNDWLLSSNHTSTFFPKKSASIHHLLLVHAKDCSVTMGRANLACDRSAPCPFICMSAHSLTVQLFWRPSALSVHTGLPR
jgi:hypothetical protein